MGCFGLNILLLLFMFLNLKQVINTTFKSQIFNIIKGLRLKPVFQKQGPLFVSKSMCCMECLSDMHCKALSFNPEFGLCELSDYNPYDDGASLEADEKWDVWYMHDYSKELVLRATAHNRISVFDTWIGTNTETLPMYTSACLSMETTSCNTHFRSFLIDQWEFINVEKVFVELYVNGVKVVYITFDGKNSNKANWFSPNKIIDSSFHNLNGPYNIFSIEGHDICGRHFFINRQYGGCDKDIGWMVVVDTFGCCLWDNKIYPSFLFSNATFLWKLGHSVADVFAVFIQRASTKNAD